ncbi:MAG: hypothetical protein LBF43_04210 [Puniceicoccales bacterium]|nr:hypothetical protein [Puniceicoccales bacterium]
MASNSHKAIPYSNLNSPSAPEKTSLPSIAFLIIIAASAALRCAARQLASSIIARNTLQNMGL